MAASHAKDITTGLVNSLKNGPYCQKTSLRGFQPCQTQAGLYSHRRWLAAWNFRLRKKKECTIYEAKTKALMSGERADCVSICIFVFRKCRKQVF